MRTISFQRVTKYLRGEPIIENLSVTIPGGTFFALLGPSGSGKTTLLRLLAGFDVVDSGTILLGDEDITHVPSYERRINTVFQHYALFPHMNVFDNVAFGLRLKKIPEEIVREKVNKFLRIVRLEKYVYKSVLHLSGGQQQRVALARAIINEPEVLLLDEPLAALDFKLREHMLLELIDLQAELGTTFVYVTHDQLEALTVADHMAIMNYDGDIEQIGTPKEIYEFPASSFVAQFVGTTNIMHGVLKIVDQLYSIVIDGLGTFEVEIPKDKQFINEMPLAISLRPEKIELSKQELVGFSNHMIGKVESIVYHGRSTQYNVRLVNNFLIQAFEQNDEHFPKEVIDYNDLVHVYWQKENALLLST